MSWTQISTGASATYVEIDPSSAAVYSDVNTSQSPEWVEILWTLFGGNWQDQYAWLDVKYWED